MTYNLTPSWGRRDEFIPCTKVNVTNSPAIQTQLANFTLWDVIHYITLTFFFFFKYTCTIINIFKGDTSANSAEVGFVSYPQKNQAGQTLIILFKKNKKKTCLLKHLYPPNITFIVMRSLKYGSTTKKELNVLFQAALSYSLVLIACREQTIFIL